MTNKNGGYNGKRYLYEICKADYYELPVAVFDTIAECAEWLECTNASVMYAITNNTVCRGEYRIYQVEVKHETL